MKAAEFSRAQQFNNFCNDGYFVAEQVLSATDLVKARHALFLPFYNICKHLGLPIPEENNWQSLHESMVSLKNNDQAAYLNAIKISQNDPQILAIPNNTGVKRALSVAGIEQPVVSLKPFPVMVSKALHIDGGYNLRPAHQEWPVMQGSTDGLVMWIALHDIDKRHNALELIPGSHLKGLRNFERSICGTKVIDAEMPENHPKRVEIKAGDAILFSCFTMHRTSPNGQDLRAAITIRFNNLASKDFISRGYPDPSKVEIERSPANMYRPVSIVRHREADR